MIKNLIQRPLIWAIALLLVGGYVLAKPKGVIITSAEICNSFVPTQCVAVDSFGQIPTSPYPAVATPITGNGTGTTGAVVGTLAAATTKTTYICGVNVSAIGGTGAVGPITIAGLITGNMTLQLASTVSGNTVTIPFSPCVPSSAVNTAITTTTTADGSASNVSVNSWGYQQ